MSEAVSEAWAGVAHVRKQLEEEPWSVSVSPCKPDDGAAMSMILVSRTQFKFCFCGGFFFKKEKGSATRTPACETCNKRKWWMQGRDVTHNQAE